MSQVPPPRPVIERDLDHQTVFVIINADTDGVATFLDESTQWPQGYYRTALPQTLPK